MPFTVSLHDFPGLPSDAKLAAEQRFKHALERELGDDVMPVFRAFQAAADSSAADLSADDYALANAWPKAYELAKTAGFRGLGDADEAYFEVRPA